MEIFLKLMENFSKLMEFCAKFMEFVLHHCTIAPLHRLVNSMWWRIWQLGERVAIDLYILYIYYNIYIIYININKSLMVHNAT